MKFRITHGVVGSEVALDSADCARKLERMLEANLSNILISRIESDVTVDQDDTDNGMETLTRLVFNVRVARPA